MPKDTSAPSSSSNTHRVRRHNPLHEEILENGNNGILRDPTRSKKRKSGGGVGGNVEDYVDSGMSRKILNLAREQQDEVEREEAVTRGNRRISAGSSRGGSGSPFGTSSSRFLMAEDVEVEEDSDDEEFEDGGFFEEEEVEEVAVDEEDLALFNKFLPEGQPTQRISLADKILEKIAQHEAAMAGDSTGGPGGTADEPPVPTIPPKVVEVYTRVGLLLSRYKSGKIPKAFKIIPSLKNWEEILFLTRPDKWSPNACYAATKIFASNLKSAQTQKFLTHILLDRVRDDIQENKKLNIHLYRSLKKSLYKPAAFFKGFLFPLASSTTCTLKEAQIISSVLTRVSIPVLHSAAALLRLCEMDYTGPTSLFIRVLLDKKYALPYKVIDSLVFHFLRFKASPEQLPLLWHQSFLSFAQRYKNDITEDQRDTLLDLLQVKGHPLVGPEVRRELLQGKGRGVVVQPVLMGNGVNGLGSSISSGGSFTNGINGTSGDHVVGAGAGVRPEDDLMMDI